MRFADRAEDGEHCDQSTCVDKESPGGAGGVLDVISRGGGYR